MADYGKAFWGAYSVSKFAVKGLAEIFRDELENIHDLKMRTFFFLLDLNIYNHFYSYIFILLMN